VSGGPQIKPSIHDQFLDCPGRAMIFLVLQHWKS